MVFLALVANPGAVGSSRWVPADGLRMARVASGLADPLFVTAPSGDSRLFVVEQSGRIRVLRGGRLLPKSFLDLTSSVRSGGERGLLGLAFHPRYASNGLFFVNFTDRDGNTRIERFQANGDSDVADAQSGALVLRIEQPYANHNGGMIAFGPDSMLWIGMGDGGSGGDPHGNGQNPRALLGKLLRIDVDRRQPYAIPSGNPWADGRVGRPEIWATGLRNPWRFSFDRGSRHLYVADVGQNQWEEVDVVDASTPGLNYGWNAREGLHPYGAERALAGSVVDPVIEYGHDAGCSVTGGYCYRGRLLEGLQGTYFFSDYCQGWLRSFRWANGRATETRQWSVGEIGPVTSFGEDAAGEVYVTNSKGDVLRIEPKR